MAQSRTHRSVVEGGGQVAIVGKALEASGRVVGIEQMWSSVRDDRVFRAGEE